METFQLRIQVGELSPLPVQTVAQEAQEVRAVQEVRGQAEMVPEARVAQVARPE